MKNPVGEAIDEVRALRDRVSARFGHDIRRYAEYCRQMQKDLPNPVISDEDGTAGTAKKPAA